MNTLGFLGLNFRPITLDHQNELEDFLKRYPQKVANYTFAILAAWSTVYFFEWIFFEKDTLLISVYIDSEKKRHLLQPIGVFPEKTQDALLNAMTKYEYPMKIFGVSDDFMKQQKHFCDHFKDFNDPKRANYVYKAEDLATLRGRRYDKKRNLISQAEALYKWTLHPLTEECKPLCPKILTEIGAKPVEMTAELNNDLKALDFMMSNFSKLKQKGVLIRIDGKPAAFSIYETLDPQTAVVHFEKADRSYKGLYQLINRETAKGIVNDGFEFINREEDLGVKGLHQAKMSYHPVELVSSHTLTFS